jgi:hypothetical protein
MTKAGGGKAAFRQAELFAVPWAERSRYFDIALGKFLYPTVHHIYALTPLSEEHFSFRHSYQVDCCSIGRLLQALVGGDYLPRLQRLYSKDLQVGQDNAASIDHQLLRLDMYEHVFFQLGLTWTSRHVTYNDHKRTGEYARRYLEVDLRAVKADYWPRLFYALDALLPRALSWTIVLDQPLSLDGLHLTSAVRHLRMNQFHTRCLPGHIDVDDDQQILDAVNQLALDSILDPAHEGTLGSVQAGSPESIQEGTLVHHYVVEDAAFDLLRLFELAGEDSIWMVTVHGSPHGVLAHGDQQHPLSAAQHDAPLLAIMPDIRSSDGVPHAPEPNVDLSNEQRLSIILNYA